MTTKLCLSERTLSISIFWIFTYSVLSLGCTKKKTKPIPKVTPESIYVKVLGIAQDAGFPQSGCMKDCCAHVWQHPKDRKRVVSLGIVDPIHKTNWMIDASPDFPDQYQELSISAPTHQFGGIFITHAHIGHYTGLMHLGREAMGSQSVPVYTMPKMQSFLDSNGPWSQLVKLKNIVLHTLKADSSQVQNSHFAITPILVPHRDEFSETVGYHVKGPNRSLLFIPDIDKWEKWNQDIREWVRQVDYALLDGSFYQNGEIPGRDMSQIPHPFIEESLKLFAPLSEKDRNKIYFIHFNHTNPVLQANSAARKEIYQNGMQIAEEGMHFEL